MATGMMPDVGLIGGGAIGTSLVFGDSSGFIRKRSFEAIIADEWSPPVQAARESKRTKGER